MNNYLTVAILLFFTACNSSHSKKENGNDKTLVNVDSLIAPAIENSGIEDSSYTEMATYYIVIADTNTDYYFLQKKMYALSKSIRLPVDTMGRYYNKTKDLIALPDNDEDEMYRGEYYPRRSPAEHLSMEYFNFYIPTSGDKTIALVSGIFEKEEEAAKALIILKKEESKAFKVKAEVFIGCMH